MTLKEMVTEYESLLTRKEEIAAEEKEIAARIAAAKEAIAAQMVEDDCPAVSFGGYSYSLANKVAYSKRSESELASKGLNYFETLREEGLGDIIVETVNSRTLNSTLKAYVDENGALSDALAAVISSYEYTDINRRKVPAGRRKK